MGFWTELGKFSPDGSAAETVPPVGVPSSSNGNTKVMLNRGITFLADIATDRGAHPFLDLPMISHLSPTMLLNVDSKNIARLFSLNQVNLPSPNINNFIADRTALKAQQLQ